MQKKIILSRPYNLETWDAFLKFSNEVLNYSVNRKAYKRWLGISFFFLFAITASYLFTMIGGIYSIVTKSSLHWIGIFGLVAIVIASLIIWFRMVPFWGNSYRPEHLCSVFNPWPIICPKKYGLYSLFNICILLNSDKYKDLTKTAYENIKFNSIMLSYTLTGDWTHNHRKYKEIWFNDYISEKNISSRKGTMIISSMVTLLELFSYDERFPTKDIFLLYDENAKPDLEPKKWFYINHNFFFYFSFTILVLSAFVFAMSIAIISL